MTSASALEFGLTLCLHVSVVVLATVVLVRWVADARGASRLWTICFVSILGLLAVGLLLPHRRLFAFPSFASRETVLGIVNWETRLASGLFSLWLAGALVAVIGRGVRCLRLLAFLKRRCRIAALPADLFGGESPLERDHRLKGLKILVSDEIQGPFCWQLQRPVIVLPGYLIKQARQLTKVDRAALRHVILHELEHLRTKHPMQHFLQGACSAVLWFHPAVWFAARRAELTREYLCDEVAAVTDGKIAGYLRTLATIAERCRGQSCSGLPPGTLAFGNQKSTLIRRTDRLVALAERPMQPAPRAGRTALALAGLVCATIMVQQVWLPTNAMASSRSGWSPWPTWTARALHTFEIRVRDFEPFDERTEMHELIGDDD